jgi:hypothetical protein
MLKLLQDAISELYDIELDVDVQDFLCTEEIARELAGDAVLRGEVLLVAEDGEDLEVSLYVDELAVDALGASEAWATPTRFAPFCLVAEGVSHFVYLVHRARHREPVSQFELELQAEIDKYALAVLSAAHEERFWVSRRVRDGLFVRARFIDDARTDEGKRYRRASALGARYAAHLEKHLRRGDARTFATDLRRFYRLGAGAKVEHIRRSVAGTRPPPSC